MCKRPPLEMKWVMGAACSTCLYPDFTHCPAAVVCPVSRALLASCALSPLLAKTGASSKFIRAPAAVHLAGWYVWWACGSLGEVLDEAVDSSSRRMCVRVGSGDSGSQGVLWPWGSYWEPGVLLISHPHRALFAPCPAQRASMDPTVPRNVAATTVASVTDSLGSATVPRATQVIGE